MYLKYFKKCQTAETFVNNLLDFYNDSIVTYKHTFKLNNDNQYYWYSTEPVK